MFENVSSAYAGDHGLQPVEECENKLCCFGGFRHRKHEADEPCEAERESISAKQGHIQVPRALPVGLRLRPYGHLGLPCFFVSNPLPPRLGGGRMKQKGGGNAKWEMP